VAIHLVPFSQGGRPEGNKATAAATSADPLEAAQAVKALEDKYGAATVKGLAELPGK
jgi:hypothetical protein